MSAPRTHQPARRVHFVLKVDVPAILEHRVQTKLLQLIAELPVERPRVSLTRGEYLQHDDGRRERTRLVRRRDITPKGR